MGEWITRRAHAVSAVEIVSGMSDADRCAYELAIAREHREVIEHRHQKWLKACADRMGVCLEMEAA